MSDIKTRPCVCTLPSLAARVSRSCVISAAILSTSSSNMLMHSTSLAESCRETARCSRLARRSSSAARLTSPDFCSCAVHRHPDQLTTWYSISSRGGCNTASQLLNKVRGTWTSNAWFHKFYYTPTFAEIHCSCDKVYHKQEVYAFYCI